MQNEFEKQVQQKLEELDFVPSAPVWEKVEKQIRKKKEKRRAIIWLPLLFLLLGAGFWWLEEEQGARADHQTTSTSIQPSVTQDEIQDTRTIREQEKAGLIEKAGPGNHVSMTPPIRQKESKYRPARPLISSIIRKQQTVPEGPSSLSGSKKGQMKITKELPRISDPDVTLSEPQVFSMNSSVRVNDPVAAVSLTSKKDLSLPMLVDPSKYSHIVKSAPIIHRKGVHKTPWRLGLVAGAGWSAGSGKGLEQIGDGQQKSLSAMPAAVNIRPPFISYRGPSAVTKGPSFLAGLVAKKEMGKKWGFFTGLEYNYLSTRTTVGNKMAPTAVSLSADFAASRSYDNFGTRQSDYYNQYHFIVVPVGIDYRPIRRLPLSLNAGLSIRQLLKTTALQYNYQSRLYYYDSKAFGKTQVFSQAGLDYVLNRKKASWLLGPQIQYGITTVQSNSVGHHLFQFGFRAQWLLQKK